jgi:alpha-1,2-mannosyltransferase
MNHGGIIPSAMNSTNRRGWSSTLRHEGDLLTIGLFALLVRLGPPVVSGGIRGLTDDYDDGVYFSAAEHFIAGALPYRDFVFPHTPGVILLLAPIAALARLIGDNWAFVLARVLVTLIGTTSAVLVAILLRRYGRAAALGGGMLYAAWGGAADAERTILLEPLLSVLLLTALLVLRTVITSARSATAAGALLGLSLAMKLWAIVPILVILVMVTAKAGLRRAGGYVAGVAAVAAAVCIPFFAFAPSQMWQDIILLQLNRPSQGISLLTRIRLFGGGSHFGADGVFGVPLPKPLWFLGAGVMVMLILWPILAAVARRQRPGTWEDSVWWSLIGLAQITVLVLSPSFYFHYPNFAAPLLCLLAGVGVGVGWLAERCCKTKRWIIVAVLCVAYGDLVMGSVRGYQNFQRFEAALDRSDPSALSRLIAGQHCVWVASPAILIVAGKSTSQIARGCPMFVDPYGAVLLHTNQTVATEPEVFLYTPDWQAEVRQQWHYASAVLLDDYEQTWLDATTAAYLQDHFTPTSKLSTLTLWARR